MLRGEHLLPLMRMFQRVVMWRTGKGDAFFTAKLGATGKDLAQEEVEELDRFIGQLQEEGADTTDLECEKKIAEFGYL